MGLFDLFTKKKKAEGPLYLYSEEELNEYEAYVERCMGPYESVLHEIASPDIHLDVILVPPTPEHPFQKLVTMGAGAYRMDIPEDLREYAAEYAEYVIFLPENWDLRSAEEEDYWPVRDLKNIGRLALYSGSWLGYGHTVQADAEGSPYASNTGFNCTMLVNALSLDGEEMSLRMSSGRTVRFYQLLPVYPEELALKQREGADALLELLVKQDGFPVVDIHRENTAAE